MTWTHGYCEATRNPEVQLPPQTQTQWKTSWSLQDSHHQGTIVYIFLDRKTDASNSLSNILSNYLTSLVLVTNYFIPFPTSRVRAKFSPCFQKSQMLRPPVVKMRRSILGDSPVKDLKNSIAVDQNLSQTLNYTVIHNLAYWLRNSKVIKGPVPPHMYDRSNFLSSTRGKSPCIPLMRGRIPQPKDQDHHLQTSTSA